jgi:hypothetical protein
MCSFEVGVDTTDVQSNSPNENLLLARYYRRWANEEYVVAMSHNRPSLACEQKGKRRHNLDRKGSEYEPFIQVLGDGLKSRLRPSFSFLL